MAERRNRKKPPRPRGTRTRVSKNKKASRKASAAERARLRYRITRFTLDQPDDLNLKQLHALVQEKVAAGELPSPAPAYSTLLNWINMAKAVQEEQGRPICQADYVDARRTGRPEKEFHPVLREYLDQELVLLSFSSVAGLHRDLLEFAEAKGIEDLPTLAMVEREVKALDLEEQSAAMHGSRAAVLDSMPKATVPADYPHEVWTLDEFMSPVLVRVVHPHTGKLGAVRPWVILIADNCSRAILAHHVAPPYRYGVTVSFHEEDVLGTVLGAALPGLAHKACVEYAGYLPETLRWDKASTHRALRAKLVEHNINVPQLPGEQPHKRGSIERLVGTTKDLLASIRGHKDSWKPIKRTGSGKAETKRSYATRKYAGRKPRRRAIPVEDLLTYDEFVEILDEKIYDYNHRTHRMLGTSPHAVHLGKFRKDRARPGRDALFLLEPRVLTCTKGGIEYGNTPFAWDSGGQRLKVGQEVICRADPLLRGLYADVNGDVLFLEPLSQWARKMSGADLDRERNEHARELSEHAAGVRAQRLADEVGEEAVIEADRRLEQQKKRRAAEKKRGKGESGDSGKPAPRDQKTPERTKKSDETRMPPGMAGDPRKRIRVVNE
jgi:hypothetical protein